MFDGKWAEPVVIVEIIITLSCLLILLIKIQKEK